MSIQLISISIIQPLGDFPVNDDWAYAHSVLWLLDEHRVRLSDWIAMNLLPQTLAGGMVTVLFGFSFETLRHLTQAVALLASITIFFWFREARLNPVQALVASIALIAIPCWPVLANSYMTDLYGLVFAVPAATLLLRALHKPSPLILLAATLLASIGVLQRQVVIVVPFAYMVAWLWGNRLWTLRTLFIGATPFLATLAAEICYQTYLELGPGIPVAQQYAHGRFFPLLVKTLYGEDGMRGWVTSNIISMTGYLGLFSVGWTTWWGMRSATKGMRAAVLCSGATLIVVALTFDWLPPYQLNNVIDAAGIGPFTLYDGMPRGIVNLDRSRGIIWKVTGVGAAFGAAALLALIVATVAHLIRAGRSASRDRVFMAALNSAYLLPFIATGYFDRYLIFVLPFLFTLWSRTWPAVVSAPMVLQRWITLFWIFSMLGIGLIATHDYFAWNRTRWSAINTAESLGATPDTLDGGFEYNGFHRFERKPHDPLPGKSWWWVKDDLYVVAFSPVPGYEDIETLPVRCWFPRSPAQIILLRRK